MMGRPSARDSDAVDTSPAVGDQIKYTTCYMCACRCGIKVYLQDGRIRYIQGNPNHPVNRGVLCAKGSAGIMTHNSPARLSKPLKRIGPRGSGEFEEIEWEEAMLTATAWLGHIRATDPKKLAFFTGRDQSQAFTGLPLVPMPKSGASGTIGKSTAAASTNWLMSAILPSGESSSHWSRKKISLPLWTVLTRTLLAVP